MSFYTSPHYLKNTKSKGNIIFFLLVTSFLFLSDPSVIPVIFQSISDAYLQVSTFVAATNPYIDGGLCNGSTAVEIAE